MTDSGRESVLRDLTTLYLGKTPDTASAFPVTEASWMPRGWKLQVTGIDTFEQARALAGCSVYGERSALPKTEANEYYLADLQGATAVDAVTGKPVGTYRGVESTGGSDRWWFDGPEGEFAVPAIRRFVLEVDPAGKRIVLQNLGDLATED